MFEGLRRSIGKLLENVVKTDIKAKDLESLLWDFKLALIENDVALYVAEKICDQVTKKLVGLEINRFENRKKIVEEVLREILYDIIVPQRKIDVLNIAEQKRQKREPIIIVFVGINGTGKTTTMGKVAYLLLKNGYSTVFAGSDTYRAGSIEQLEGHAKRLGIRVIKHGYGADAAAVAFDAIKYARAHGINAVLVDTAGRMQTNRNLMEAMQKIIKVTDPDLILFVGDALTGNDAVEQAKDFSKFIEFDASILTKVDADAKGGAAISISYITKKPTIYLGIGQFYEDLIPFDPDFLIDKILVQ